MEGGGAELGQTGTEGSGVSVGHAAVLGHVAEQEVDDLGQMRGEGCGQAAEAEAEGSDDFGASAIPAADAARERWWWMADAVVTADSRPMKTTVHTASAARMRKMRGVGPEGVVGATRTGAGIISVTRSADAPAGKGELLCCALWVICGDEQWGSCARAGGRCGGCSFVWSPYFHLNLFRARIYSENAQ